MVEFYYAVEVSLWEGDKCLLCEPLSVVDTPFDAGVYIGDALLSFLQEGEEEEVYPAVVKELVRALSDTPRWKSERYFRTTLETLNGHRLEILTYRFYSLKENPDPDPEMEEVEVSPITSSDLSSLISGLEETLDEGF